MYQKELRNGRKERSRAVAVAQALFLPSELIEPNADDLHSKLARAKILHDPLDGGGKKAYSARWKCEKDF